MQVHVMHGIRHATVLADQPHVLRADEEGERALGLGQIRARTGEFTASSSCPRQRSWMRSGVALSTVPRSMLRIPTIPATRSEAGCQSSSLRGAAWITLARFVDHDAVAQPVRLREIVRDENGRHAPLGQDAPQLVAQRLGAASRRARRAARRAGGSAGIGRERPAESDTLALTS